MYIYEEIDICVVQEGRKKCSVYFRIVCSSGRMDKMHKVYSN